MTTLKIRRSKNVSVPLGEHIALDLTRLMRTNLAIVGNPDSGKSLALRSIIEKTEPKVSQIIIDTMGEYWTLRKHFDYLLVGDVGEGADLPNDPSMASDLARLVREKSCRVIVDLSDLDEVEQQLFVTNLCNALLKLPRTLWKTPLIVFVEEVHVFAPEIGHPASRKALGKLGKMGRKQRICLAVATQNLSETSKGLLGSMNNRMYGRFADDSDLKRATENLGFSGRTKWETMKDMLAGEFHCRGPAFGHRGVILARTNKNTVSRHIDPGDNIEFKPAPASKAVKGLAKDLFAKQAAIAEAERAKQDELGTLRKRVKELEGGEVKKLRDRIAQLESDANKKAAPAKPTAPPRALSKEQLAALKSKFEAELGAMRAKHGTELTAVKKKAFVRAAQIFGVFTSAAEARIAEEATSESKTTAAATRRADRAASEELLTKILETSLAPVADPNFTPVHRDILRRAQGPDIHTRALNGARARHAENILPPSARRTPARQGTGAKDAAVGKGSLCRILTALAQHPEGLDRHQLAMFSGVSIRSSGFSNNISTMNVNGWAEKRGGEIFATQAGLDALGPFIPVPDGAALVQYWLDFCGNGSKRRLLQSLIDAGQAGLDREALAANADVSITSSGFSNGLSELCVAKFIYGSKHLYASEVLRNANSRG